MGYFLELDLKYPDEIKQKTKSFPFSLEKKVSLPEKLTDYMKQSSPENHSQCKKLICDWTDKKRYLIHSRRLKFSVIHGINVENVHEIISFKQSKWLEKYINLNTEKRNRAKNDFEKSFYKLINDALYGKTMGNVKNRVFLN